MKNLIFLFVFVLFFVTIDAQNTFQKTVIDVGNCGLTVSNVGTIGRPNVRNDPAGDPSLEYPKNSGIEHLFEGGLWIGAIQDGQLKLSTASIDATGGYVSGSMGFEFTPSGDQQIKQRSTLTQSEFFSQNAVSHQDVVFDITDANVVIPGSNIPITDHNNPLNAEVHAEYYAWNYSFADYFIILNYEIENTSNEKWDSVYLGLWTDLIVRNVNVSTDGGAAFFNKGAGGYLAENQALYVFDVNGDPGFTNSYAASQFLGITWRDLFFHPNNAQTFLDLGYTAPRVEANFWNFRTFDGTVFSAPFNNDNAFVEAIAYEKMQKGLDFENAYLRGQVQTASNRTQLLSAGPIAEILPGEKISFALAIVCAKQIANGETTGPEMDTEDARVELVEHLGWAKRTFNGEDINENGILDAGEDLNDNDILDRYILPEPPATPNTRIEISNNKVDIYWDNDAESSIDPISKKLDFEGYRLYRTKVGDEFDLDLIGSAEVIAQWDKAGNNVGFNNEFNSVELSSPQYFEDDSIEYNYKFTNTDLLNGWQYLYILTSFDEGDEALGLESLESSFIANAKRVFLGTPVNTDEENVEIGVYPNPYRLSAAWDGSTERSRKIHFYNLPANCIVKIYTLAGDIVTSFEHNADTYNGNDIAWYDNFGGPESQRQFSGGEHAWDLLSESKQAITQGMYLYSVENTQSGKVSKGQFAVLR